MLKFKSIIVRRLGREWRSRVKQCPFDGRLCMLTRELINVSFPTFKGKLVKVCMLMREFRD